MRWLVSQLRNCDSNLQPFLAPVQCKPPGYVITADIGRGNATGHRLSVPCVCYKSLAREIVEENGH